MAVKIPEGFVIQRQEAVTIPPGFELESQQAPFITQTETVAAETRQQPETLKQAFTGELRETPETKAFPEFAETEDIEIGLDSS